MPPGFDPDQLGSSRAGTSVVLYSPSKRAVGSNLRAASHSEVQKSSAEFQGEAVWTCLETTGVKCHEV